MKKLYKTLFLACVATLLAGYSNCIAQVKANFSADITSGCSPQVIKFTDLSSGNPTSWKWDLGNGTISFLENPSATYFTPGSYNITLIASNGAGADTVVKSGYITINPTPVVDFATVPVTGCFPLTVQFTDQSQTATGSISTWEWDFGDGNASNLKNPSHIYGATGSYSVSLRVSNNFGCVNSITKAGLIQVSTGVKANFSNSTPNTCTPPIAIIFSDSSKGPDTLTYLWDFGDGNNSTAQNPTHNYTNNGNYNVTLVVTSSVGCKDSITRLNAINLGTVKANFTTPSTICEGNAFQLTNTSSPTPANVKWDFGDGTNSIATNPIKVFTSAGTYAIKLVANFGACLDSVTKMITVFAKPTSAFSSTKAQQCKPPLTVSFTSNSPGAAQYKWYFGTGDSSLSANPTYTYSALGTYDVTLITTNASGCSDTLVKSAYVQIQPISTKILNLPVTGCAPIINTFTPQVISPDPVATYHWDFGDGTTSTASNPTHSFDTGRFTITLIVTTTNGCIDTATYKNGVVAGLVPTPFFRADPLEVCAKQQVQFIDSTQGPVDQWFWTFGDGGTSTDEAPIHKFADTGYFSVRLIVYHNGCPDTLDKPNYIHVNPPVAAFTITTNCASPLTRAFKDTSTGADTWLWDFGDGQTSTLQNPVHTYSASGYYNVLLTVTNTASGCSDQHLEAIRVVSEAGILSASQSAVCKGIPVAFQVQGVNTNNIASFYWNFGDGFTTTTTTNALNHAFKSSGTFSVNVQLLDANGCISSVPPISISVSGPTAGFTVTNPTCSGSVATFNDTSKTDGIHPIIKWIWYFGDGNIQTYAAPPFQHTYTVGGTYPVMLIVVDNLGCRDSLYNGAAVQVSRPIANFKSDTLTCTNSQVKFTNLSTGNTLSYLWDFGDATTSTQVNPIHLYATQAVYTVKLIATDIYGCKNTVTKANAVNIANAKANFTVNDSISTCPPLVVNFTNTSKNFVSYSWDFGDNSSSTSLNPTHFYNTVGIYKARLIVVASGGCSDTMYRTITIKGPQGSFTYNQLSGCIPLDVAFSATTKNSSSVVWDFSDGVTQVATSLQTTHTYNYPSFYVPKMILRDSGGCIIAITGKDTIKAFGAATKFGISSTKFCDFGTAQFTDSTITDDSITLFVWNFGDGTSSFNRNPTHTWTTPGVYPINLQVVTQHGCAAFSQSAVPVKVYASPQVDITGTLSGCTPLKQTFSGKLNFADTTGLAWRWGFGNGNTSNLQNPPQQTFTIPADYNVTLIATSGSGCADTVSKVVHAFPVPVVTTPLGNITVCNGSSATLSASGATNYFWSPAKNLSCTNCPSPKVTPDSSRKYTVTGFNSFGCSNSTSINVAVIYHSLMSFGGNAEICEGMPTRLFASGSQHYLWVPSAGLNNDTIASPTATPTQTTVYTVYGSDDAKCFIDTGRVTVKVYPKPAINAGQDLTLPIGRLTNITPTISPDVTATAWTPSTGIVSYNFPGIQIRPTQDITYIVEASNPGGCKNADTINIKVFCNDANVFMPNTFTPNGDGVNDIFYPRGTGIFSIKSLHIYSRWGEEVFVKTNIKANIPEAGWDGVYKGRPAPSDVYVYTMELICENNAILTTKGNVALVR